MNQLERKYIPQSKILNIACTSRQKHIHGIGTWNFWTQHAMFSAYQSLLGISVVQLYTDGESGVEASILHRIKFLLIPLSVRQRHYIQCASQIPIETVSGSKFFEVFSQANSTKNDLKSVLYLGQLIILLFEVRNDEFECSIQQ